MPLKRPYQPMESPRTVILKEMRHFGRMDGWTYEAADDTELRITKIVMAQQPMFSCLAQKQILAKRLAKLRCEITMDYELKRRGERYADVAINEDLNLLPREAYYQPHMSFIMAPEKEPEHYGWTELEEPSNDHEESHDSDATVAS